jgi:hypothetical protein
LAASASRFDAAAWSACASTHACRQQQAVATRGCRRIRVGSQQERRCAARNQLLAAHVHSQHTANKPQRNPSPSVCHKHKHIHSAATSPAGPSAAWSAADSHALTRHGTGYQYNPVTRQTSPQQVNQNQWQTPLQTTVILQLHC